MGLLDTLLGNTSADAAKAAAADTYAKQQTAVSGIQGAGQSYATGFGDLSKAFAPYAATGGAANDALRNLLADPSSVASLPGYQFDLSQGTKAIDHSAVSNGNLFSGKTGKALEAYGTNLADKTYGDQLSRLLGVSNTGQQATGQTVATAGTGLTGQLGANTSAYNGQMTDAGTIGQGDIAAANAKTSAWQNLLNLAAGGIGMAAGGGSGGTSGIMKLLNPGGSSGQIVLGGAGGPGQFRS